MKSFAVCAFALMACLCNKLGVNAESKVIHEAIDQATAALDASAQEQQAQLAQLQQQDQLAPKTALDRQEVEGEEGPCRRKVVCLEADGEWSKFIFNKAGTTIDTTFLINIDTKALLDVTDFYCPGDSFRVYDNGVSIGRTPLKRANNCHHKTLDPEVAFEHPKIWSSRTFELCPGQHVINIKVVRSPYCGGAGAIRLRPLLLTCVQQPPQCDKPVLPCGDEFVVISSKIPFCQAEAACRSLGLQLANLTNDNFLHATSVAFQASGAFSQTWIKSWYGDSYGDSCLVLSTGATAPGGAINVPNCCEVGLPVLCQRCH